jgi:ribonuclease HI
MKIPSKSKIFLWRALHGILPLKCVLANRHVGTEGGCPICNSGPEDVLHLLFTCPVAMDLWAVLGLSQVIQEGIQTDLSGSAVLEFLLTNQETPYHNLDVGLKEVIGISCWYLWWMRRRRTHGEDVPSVNNCKLSILSMVANFAKVSKPQSGDQGKWLPPEPRFIKLNVDATFFADSCTGATGAILRDYKGRFIAAATTFISHVRTSSMAEAVAMKEGLALADRLGFHHIRAESDSTETVDACNNGDRWWSEETAIFADCIDLAASIGDVSFKHCPRNTNVVTHEIARFGFDSKISCTWDDEPPSFLLSSIINDVTV